MSAGTTATDSLGFETNVTSGRVFVASSSDHGNTWTCSSKPVSGGTAVMPWLSAGSSGMDVVYYATSTNPTSSKATWSAEFHQFTNGKWGSPSAVTTVHTGPVCEGGANCSANRQLFDDFGVANDANGWAHIAYSHDAPKLGGSDSYTGSAVQTSGTTIGAPN